MDPDDIAGKIPPATGKLLIATPFLSDPSFSRSVVFLCEHGPDGTLGFVLNQLTSYTLGDLLSETTYIQPLSVYQGGPVQPETLHIVHRIPAALGGTDVVNGIHWGGSYEQLQEMARNYGSNENDLRLFLGYAGWTEGQLEKEIQEGSWLVGEPTQELVFETEPHLVWKKAISALGRNYEFLSNMPVDPQLN